jgi:hypothetical protein
MALNTTFTATTVTRIIREFPRNEWLVVSPMQEVALTYGHGWHMELWEFVDKYTVAQVSRPDFSFKFPVSDTFVFVEKQPLTSQTMASDLSERNAEVFLEDPRLIVYRIRG